MEHFNGLTPAELEGLAILAEECGEVVQRVGKILRHGKRKWDGTSNVERLESEVGDIQAIVEVLVDLGVVSAGELRQHRDEKLRKFREEPDRLHHISVRSPR
jgi:NTP pyrophosphatase (non-canonical NTP hydrolase)